MAKTMYFIVTSVLLGFMLNGVYSIAVERDGELFDTLLARIESLEASDVTNKARIESLEASDVTNKARIESLEASDATNKAKITEMESEFKLKEATLLGAIKKLTSTLTESNENSAADQPGANDDTDRRLSGPNRIQRRGKNFRQYRETPEVEVAFYATHQDHNIHHMGSNQILEFPVDVTNIGHAYNSQTGGFTAPVDGTYVIHATVMGIDVASNQHMRAHFDVNGTRYSMFYVTPLDQSSQMLVIELKAGDTVSVRNDYTDAGFVGQHYTTFSGFLLYQHYPSGAILGK